MSPSIWPSLIAFVVVIALIPLALALLKRAQGLRPNRQGMLNLIGGLSVGPRERIAVIEAGGKRLVVGITAQSINLLTTLDDPVIGTGAVTSGMAPFAAPRPNAETIDEVFRETMIDPVDTPSVAAANTPAAVHATPPAPPPTDTPATAQATVIASPFADLLAAMKKNAPHES